MLLLFYTSVFCLFVILPLNSQEIQEKKNYTDDKGLKQGYWKKKYQNGNIQYHGTFKDGRPVGELTRYFPNGNKMAVMIFCEEGKRANAKLFYEEGNLAAKGIYVEEQKDSVWKYFSFYDNHLTSTETYNNGIKEGLSSVYYLNGRLSESFWYENDIRNGPWIQYYENGRMRIEAEFKDDQRHGDFVLYTPRGRIEMEGQYLNNQMNGEWTFYDESGKIVSVIIYIDGRPENENELIEKEQEMFRQIEQMRGRIPEPDESEIFSPQRR